MNTNFQQTMTDFKAMKVIVNYHLPTTDSRAFCYILMTRKEYARHSPIQTDWFFEEKVFFPAENVSA